MPVYLYQGLTSGETFSLEQRISEAALTHHPQTGEPVKRLIGKPAIAFKGTGFYANDSKSSSGQSAEKKPEAPSSESKPETSSSESKPEAKAVESKTESKPAEVTAAVKS